MRVRTPSRFRAGRLSLLSVAALMSACVGVIDGVSPSEHSDPGVERPTTGTSSPGRTGGSSTSSDPSSTTSAPAMGTTPAATAGEPAGPTCSSTLDLKLPRRIWRLTGPQYQATVKAVFPDLGFEPANPFVNEQLLGRYSTQSDHLQLPLALTEGLFEENQKVAAAGGKLVLKQNACLSAGADAACVSGVIKSLGSKIFRRPLAEAEVDRYRAFFDRNKADLGATDATLLLVRVLLSSPNAIFIWGAGTATDGKLTPYEIASALSYVASQRPPDDRLLSLAADNSLTRAEVIETELKRLLEQSGHQSAVRFFKEFLSYHVLLDQDRDEQMFPNYTPKLGVGLVADTDEFVKEHLRTGANVADLLTAGFVMVQPGTAAVYGLDGRASSTGFTKVTVTDRLGILTQPAFLASQHEPEHTNPVRIGKQIRENLLCLDVPPPPPDVPALVDQKEEQKKTQTVRERLAQHREDPGCAACHALLDPLGLAFEGYDALGQKRTQELGRSVDVTGELKGSDGFDGPVKDAADMIGRLSRSQQVRSCFVQNAYAYLAGLDLDGDAGRCIAGRVKARLDAKGEPSLMDVLAAAMSDYLLAERK
jgi:hypothetical protein